MAWARSLASISSLQTPFCHHPHHLSLLCPPCLPVTLSFQSPINTLFFKSTVLIWFLCSKACIDRPVLSYRLIYKFSFASIVVSILSLFQCVFTSQGFLAYDLCPSPIGAHTPETPGLCSIDVLHPNPFHLRSFKTPTHPSVFILMPLPGSLPCCA